MSVRINTNVEALNAQRNLGTTSVAFGKAVEKLSSGLRINRAADDAAGLAISEKLRSQVRGLGQAQRNAQDGISMVQTAEGALNEVHSMLQRMRELAVQASNSTLSTADAASIDTEVTALKAEINRITGSTAFNGQHLLTGALTATQTGGSLAAGTSLATGGAATITRVDVSAAAAGRTYTLTAQAGGKVTLDDGAGTIQQVTITAGTTDVSVNFDRLGVRIDMVGATSKTAADYAADLAAVGGGGGAGSSLVSGEVLTTRSVIMAGSGIKYNGTSGFSDSGDTTPMTASAGVGVGPGTLQITSANITIGTGAISVAYDGGTFTGALDTPTANKTSTTTLTDGGGRTITLTYKQGSSPTTAGMRSAMVSMALTSFDIAAAGTTGTIGAMHGDPTAAAGTYNFTSDSPGQLTLTGPGGITETISTSNVPSGTAATLDFSTLGISFDVTATGGTFYWGEINGNLLQTGNNTIVVGAGGVIAAGGPTITTGGSGSANFQVGANAVDGLSVAFGDARTATYTGFDAAVAAFTSATGSGSGVIAAAQGLVRAVDTAISTVSSQRGTFGAVQNRLEHTIASLGVSAENLAASESRIRDLDIAGAMVDFTKTQILQQAGTAILAQANQAPQGILSLLR